jgi:tetratricopeptide (TPR) repeat protein
MISAELAHAENWLQGQVLENYSGAKKPAAGAQVSIVNVGNPYLTQADGGYRVLVPDAYRIGQTIVLYVKRKGWAIATPVGGKVQLSKELTTDILLSPEASPEFLSPAQLDKLLESLPEKLKNQVKSDGKEGEADPTQVVREYATEHGLPEREVIAQVAALVKQYEQSSDLGKQCLAAVYQQNLKQAATRCEQSATSKVDVLKKKRQEVESLSKSQLKSDRSVGASFAHRSGAIIRVTAPGKRLRFDTEPQGRPDALFVEAPTGKSTPAQLEEARRQLVTLTEEVVREFRATGDTYYANYQFDKALATYKEGLSYVEKKDLPTRWADMQWLIGLTNWQIGIRTKDAAIQEHLSEAVSRYREAQSVYGKGEFPEAWAAIENNLGTVLRNQGTRTGGETGTQLLAQAVEAYRAALTVYTKAQLPQAWAGTQMNLGTVLSDQGRRAAGTDSTRLLQAAEAAYREALTVYSKDQFPQDWINTSSNLAEALFLSSQFTKTSDHLAKLLDSPDLGPSQGVALLAIGIANSVALGIVERTEAEFEKTSSLLSRQDPDFFLTWDFSSIKIFIDKNPVFGNHRQWLLDLIKTLESGRRDKMRAALQTARDAFRKTTKP